MLARTLFSVSLSSLFPMRTVAKIDKLSIFAKFFRFISLAAVGASVYSSFRISVSMSPSISCRPTRLLSRSTSIQVGRRCTS